VIYSDLIFAADQAHRDESPANAEELAAKHADLVVALGVDRIPGFTARYWPDLSPAQYALLERDLDEARQRGGMRIGPSSRKKGHTLINAICGARNVVENANDPSRVAEAKAVIRNATLELRALIDNEIALTFPAGPQNTRQQAAFADLTTQTEALLRGLEL
jgi:hypothetical protein